MNNPEKEPLQEPEVSRKVLEMLTVANEFCLFLEKADDYSMEFIFAYLQKVCPLLYLKAALLPDVEAEEDDAAEHFVTEEQWEGMFNTLRIKFGKDDLYYFQDHLEKSNTDPVKASLAENFTDLYQDMKDFILLYQKPHQLAKKIAVRDCKALFENRFGYRLVNAQQVLHYRLFPDGQPGGFEEEMP